MNTSKLFGLWLAASMVLVGCAQSGSNGSTEKWGHFNNLAANSLINVPPKGSIEACGEFQSETIKAITMWAAAIGRVNGLKIVGCGQGGADAAKVTVNITGCGNASAWGNPWARSVDFCGNPDPSLVLPILAHEVGHIWGMCDQYGNWGYQNCDPNHVGSYTSNGIMSISDYTKTHLFEDDLTGIRALAARTDIAANALWTKFLSDPTSDEDHDGIVDIDDKCWGSKPDPATGKFGGDFRVWDISKIAKDSADYANALKYNGCGKGQTPRP